ncbi:hypothetical protein LEP1GSC195_1803 [Leptospira wolbachii serovar Codice str. CDC]|uniref:Lipoprotein n=1 Tax=Leptospira wolbachii serovar Codice str. CDC TaxID=1218599 RepID=R9A0B9_9LEPT|nr:hypothetical protein [Leptospira wolbachii]EOQ95434.1 hypothetical protein LEP1GSC195_1803 [Leptospira wolbachii serovar Codice str. CDC]
MKKLLTLVLLSILGVANCSSLAVVDPTKEIAPQIPKEKAIYFIKANFNAGSEKIYNVTLENFDLINSEISGHTLDLGKGNKDNPSLLTGCFLFTGNKTVYSFYKAAIRTGGGKTTSVKLIDKKSWTLSNEGSSVPIFAGTLSYLDGKLDISDVGFKECTTELSAKYPTIDFSKAEEILKRKPKAEAKKK